MTYKMQLRAFWQSEMTEIILFYCHQYFPSHIAIIHSLVVEQKHLVSVAKEFLQVSYDGLLKFISRLHLHFHSVIWQLLFPVTWLSPETVQRPSHSEDDIYSVDVQ